MGGQHLKRVLGLLGFGICVGNPDIQNAISTTGPETTDKKITSVIIGMEGEGEEAEGAGGVVSSTVPIYVILTDAAATVTNSK